MILFPFVNRDVKIRVVVVSQDPSNQLVIFSDDNYGIEQHLQDECLGRSDSSRRMIEQINDIIGRKLDPFNDTVYWTHSLKCIPSRRKAIRVDWPECSVRCINHLRSELIAIPADELVIVALGRYATGMITAIINDEKRPRAMKDFNEFIYSLGSDSAIKLEKSTPRFKQPSFWRGKQLYLTAFVLREYEEAVLKENAMKVQMEEISFIREWLER